MTVKKIQSNAELRIFQTTTANNWNKSKMGFTRNTGE